MFISSDVLKYVFNKKHRVRTKQDFTPTVFFF